LRSSANRAQRTGQDDTIFLNENGESFARAASDFFYVQRAAELAALAENPVFPALPVSLICGTFSPSRLCAAEASGSTN
jgi:hypothetical protein